jgi:bifunctional ADP-heptose synthase (sugar kinase/adenylyltransferase)
LTFSGAGDTAISAIVSSLAVGATLEEAAWIGNCASGVVVGKKGTALATPAELLITTPVLKNKSNNCCTQLSIDPCAVALVFIVYPP